MLEISHEQKTDNIASKSNSTVHSGGQSHPSMEPIVLPKNGHLIQTKMEIGAVDDPLEREADAAAERIIRLPDISESSENIQLNNENYEEEEKVQCKEITAGAVFAPDDVHSKINATRGSSGRMDNPIRSFMEYGFGVDFSNVNIHKDKSAVEMNSNLNARAFTVGSDIYFNESRYNPSSSDGKRLLAHELAHVVQQSYKGTSSGLKPYAKHKQSASKTANQATIGIGQVIVKSATAVGIARQPADSMTPVNLPKIGALTAQELMDRMVFAMRAFVASPSGPPMNPAVGQGSALGTGYSTFAAVQLIGKGGNQIITAYGQYLGSGKPHAEQEAIQKLIAFIKREKINIEGAKMMVAVDQHVCESCTASLEAFAENQGLSEMEVYLPNREGVTPKTAARTSTKEAGATVKQVYRKIFMLESHRSAPASVVPKVETHIASEPAFKKPITRPSTPTSMRIKSEVASSIKRPGVKSVGIDGSLVPTSTPSSKELTVVNTGRIVLPTRGDRLYSGVGTGLNALGVGLTVYGALKSYDDAVEQFKKARSGDLSSFAQNLEKSIDAAFPSVDEITKIVWNRSDFEAKKDYFKAYDWLSQYSIKALLNKGELLREMDRNLSKVWFYTNSLERIYNECKKNLNQMTSLKEELGKRISAINDIQKLFESMMVPAAAVRGTGITSELEIFTAIQQCEERLSDFVRLKAQVNTRFKQYISVQNEYREITQFYSYWIQMICRIEEAECVLPDFKP